MKQKVISLRAGFTNCFLLVKENHCLLVDTGTKNQTDKLLKAIRSRGKKEDDLKLVLLTHCHYDHAGSVAGIKERTGAKVMVHESEAECLEDGFMRIPKGTSPFYKFISFMGRKGPMERKIGGYDPVHPDLTFNDSFSLKPFGFDGLVIHTPGHTRGSSTLVLDDRALVGDAMFNLSGNYYPGFANDEPTLIQTWKQLLELDVRWYYPSHGRRIEKSNLLKYLKRKNIKL